MIIFWPYELYPYVLHGKSDEARRHPDGMHWVPSYTIYIRRPLLETTDEDGEEIARKLKELQRERSEARAKVDDLFLDKALDAAPFLINVEQYAGKRKARVDVEKALEHVRRLEKALKGADFVAPEIFGKVLDEAAGELNEVAKALRLLGKVPAKEEE